MAGKTDYNESEAVSEFIKKIEPSLASVVESLRRIILSSGKEIGEQIKWNSPSFFYTGEMKPFNPKEYKRDIAVVNIHRGYTLLVFPTGACVKDETGLLEANYADGKKIN